jgi:hypothetical protein
MNACVYIYTYVQVHTRTFRIHHIMALKVLILHGTADIDIHMIHLRTYAHIHKHIDLRAYIHVI